ncbi:hypothetical protein K469DRAFT_603414, partial [Zopfia rhizophila CBS 207.26]
RYNATVICAQNSELTYGQLNALLTRLARELVRCGVELEVIVPLVFKKSC